MNEKVNLFFLFFLGGGVILSKYELKSEIFEISKTENIIFLLNTFLYFFIVDIGNSQ